MAGSCRPDDVELSAFSQERFSGSVLNLYKLFNIIYNFNESIYSRVLSYVEVDVPIIIFSVLFHYSSFCCCYCCFGFY